MTRLRERADKRLLFAGPKKRETGMHAIKSQGNTWRVAAACAVLIGTLLPWSIAKADQVRIVALGDSQIAGKGVSSSEAYPAQLEAALRARGQDVVVTNAGISGDTTSGVLARLDSSVPSGTNVVVMSVGSNDYNFHQAAPASIRANADNIARRLQARGIEVVRLGTGPTFQGSIIEKPQYHVEAQKSVGAWHLNGAGYAIVVQRTLPQVLAAIARAKKRGKMS
jgi:acyl-CoA thioesterase I